MNRIWIVFPALALSAAGCKQGLGERCEVDSDCSTGVCATASPKICVSADRPTDQIDATIPIDAPGVGVDGPAVDGPAVDGP